MIRFNDWWDEAVNIMTDQGINPASDEGNLFAYAYCIERAEDRMDDSLKTIKEDEDKKRE